MEPTEPTTRIHLAKDAAEDSAATSTENAAATTTAVPPFPHGLPYGLDPLGSDSSSSTGAGTGPEAAPQPPPAAPARFTLRRSRTDRMIGGVCGGAARTFGVDAALLRIGFVLLTVFGAGAGVVVYVAAWILAPEEDAA